MIGSLDPLRAELEEAAAFAATARRHAYDPHPWVLFGSMVMLFHGLRDHVDDVDVFVSADVFEYLGARHAWELHLSQMRTDEGIECGQYAYLTRVVGGLKASVFYYGWSPGVDATACRGAGELVHGWWCIPLTVVREHKAACLRRVIDLYGYVPRRHRKHARDVRTIDAHLEALAA